MKTRQGISLSKSRLLSTAAAQSKKVVLLFIHNFYMLLQDPDGLCVCKCCPDMVLEIKCPHSIKDMTIEEGWSTTDFLEKTDKIQLKRQHKYYTQVQSQLALTKCKKSYFVVWTAEGEPLV